MNDTCENDNEISFTVKFFGRIDVVRPEGTQLLNEAVASLKTSNQALTNKGKKKKNKVDLFLSINGIDILEHETKFMLYSCPLSSVSFCAVHQTMPDLFGFVAQHPAADIHHCYLFQSKKFSHLLVSLIGDAFQAYKKEENIRGHRDLVVEALRHKNKLLLRENMELKRRLAELTGNEDIYTATRGFPPLQDLEREKRNPEDQVHPNTASYVGELGPKPVVRFQAEDDKVPLLNI